MKLGPRYLGDGVYVKQDGYGIKLYTSDGRDETNVISSSRLCGSCCPIT